jgi:uncharacterized protein YbaR (Trm112 family)
MTLAKELLEVMVCPQCKGELEQRTSMKKPGFRTESFRNDDPNRVGIESFRKDDPNRGAQSVGGEVGLVCGACRLVYEVKNDIPVMIPAEASSF